MNNPITIEEIKTYDDIHREAVVCKELLDRVSVTRKYIQEAGSCNACGRHPRFDNNAPETVREITVGDHNRCTASIRLCDQCWSNLLLKANI